MFAIIATALLAGTTVQVAQGPADLPPVAGPWSPPGTSIPFPESTGEFRRGRIVRYGPKDHSVAYDRVRDGRKVATTTVYVYVPSDGRSCSEQFADGVAAFKSTYPQAVEVSRAAADSPKAGRPGVADRTRFRLTGRFDNVEQELLSDLYVYCRAGSPWTIKYRSSWPASSGGDDGGAPELMRSIGWPAALAE